MRESYILIKPDGSKGYAGPDAIAWYKADSLRAKLELYATTGKVVMSPAAMLRLASEYSGKTYAPREHMRAANDVKKWADTLYAALPVVVQQA